VSDTQARLAHERDYIARTIATVRIHKDADNCWPQWANIFADQIESLEAELERVTAALREHRRDLLDVRDPRARARRKDARHRPCR
jgi:arylsulfatase A-like enzyme